MSAEKTHLADISEPIEAFRRGRVVLLRDTTKPERGGIVVAAAEHTCDGIITFMASFARGLVSVAMLPDRAERLGVKPQGDADGVERIAYATSIEARVGVSTGISAADRARTIQVAVAHDSHAEDLASPGHVFPALAAPGGVVTRRGWAEASVDIARVSGSQPVVTFCQVMNSEGEIANAETLDAFATEHGLSVLDIDVLIRHRMATESFVTQLSQTTLPTAHGEFVARAFVNRLDQKQHVALSLGDVLSSEPVLVRIHSECLTGDVFGSRRCDCGKQLDESLRRIHVEGRGLLLYLRQEGRGIGLVNKLRAYQLQDAGRDTVEANVELGLPVDDRDYGVAAQMLLALGVHRVVLLTNNPKKVEGLQRHGVDVVARQSVEISPSADNETYLRTKKQKLGHLLEKV